MVAALLGSTLMGICFEEAKKIINQTRNVKFGGMHEEQRDMEGPWIYELLREGTISEVVPTGYSCRVTHPGQMLVHATASGKDATWPICRWEKGDAGERNFKATTITVEGMGQAADQFAGRFCSNCEPLLRASLRLRSRQL